MRPGPLRTADVPALDAWCNEHRIDCLVHSGRPDDPETTAAVARARLRLVDVSLHIEHDLEHPSDSLSTVELRAARAGDRDALVALTSRAITTGRFVHDDRFPRDRVEALYARWIERDLEGADGRFVLVAERDGEPVGYYSWRRTTSDAAHTSLSVVASSARRSGVFSSMIDEMVRRLHREGLHRLRAVIHAENPSSLRAHERAGFLLAEVTATWHRWSDEAG